MSDRINVQLVISDSKVEIELRPLGTEQYQNWAASQVYPTADDVMNSPYGLTSYNPSAATALGQLVEYITDRYLPGHARSELEESPDFAFPILHTVDAAAVPNTASIWESGQEVSGSDPLVLISKADRLAQMGNTVDTAIETLASQLANGYSDEFKAFLDFMGRFHSYSWNNTLLILCQCPNATQVAGMRRWNDLGYTVRKGERAFWILAPMTTRVTDEKSGDEEVRLIGFRPVPVFDASQLAEIEENPLPSPWTVLPDDVEDLYQQIRDQIILSGIQIEEQPLPRGVQGSSHGGRIVINTGLDSRRRIHVLLHELAHELGHQGPDAPAITREQRELEAESVAFVVASILGLDNPTSADYLLNWEGTPDLLRASMATIKGLVKKVIEIVDDRTSMQVVPEQIAA